MTSNVKQITVPYAQLNDIEKELVQKAWSAAEHAYIPYAQFPVGVAILGEDVTGQSQIISGGNIQNQSWDVDCCAERSVTFCAFEQGFRKMKYVCMVTPKKLGGTPCGLCRQVLIELARDAKLLTVQNQDDAVQMWLVRDLLPEASIRTVTRVDELPEAERKLVEQAVKNAGSSLSPYSNTADGAALLARNQSGEEKVFNGVRIENSVFGGTVSATRVATYNAASVGYCEFLTVAVHANGPKESISYSHKGNEKEEFVNISGACLQTLRQFGDETKILNVCLSKQSVGYATIMQLLPGSFGPDAVP